MPARHNTAARPAPHRDDFPHWTTDTIRYGDLDRQNHVNNAVFLTFLETGRVLVLREPSYGLLVPDTEYALVRAVIDFRSEMRWPGTVEIGTAIARIGTSSLTLAQAVFVGERLHGQRRGHGGADRRRDAPPAAVPARAGGRMRKSAPAAPGPA